MKKMSDPAKAKIGDRIECACGAVYEFGFEGKKILEKDDARCQFCRTVLTAWPQRLNWRVMEHPRQ
jgi:hypothetical protein